jgi:hypothetical protein
MYLRPAAANDFFPAFFHLRKIKKRFYFAAFAFAGIVALSQFSVFATGLIITLPVPTGRHRRE